MKATLLLPLFMVLSVVANLGKAREAYTVDGETIVAAIVISFGLWLFGYIEGKHDK